jgi:3-oxoacyl-[acyl-carrier-protein] synthase II
MRERVVVTGIGCVSSLGTGLAPFVEGLLAGRRGIAPITAFATDGCRSHTAASLHDFDPARFIPPLKLRRIDEIGRLALVGCRLAVEHAGLPAGNDDVGVVIGSSTAGLHSTIGHMHVLATSGPAAAPALTFSNTVGNSAASLCAIEHGLRGPNVTFAQKQASALAAFAYSVEALRDGRAQGFVTGGVDDFEERFFKVHDRFGVLSPSDGGDEASRPFDRRRNGYVIGAGGHLLVLESAEAVAARGAAVLGEVLGVGTAGVPCELNNWPTTPDGAVRAMRGALDDAGLDASSVDAVFSAANGTRALDRAEAEALEQVFGPCAVPVVALKGALGESGASGAAAITAALCCLGRGMLPPTLGCEQPDQALRVDVVPSARPARGRVALVNAAAAGGSHYCVLVRSVPPPPV